MKEKEKRISPTIKAIEAERKRQNMSVTALAIKSGVHFSGLYRVLAGESVPALDTVESLTLALGLKIAVKR